MTALLEEIRNVESAEHEQQTADQLAFIFAVWSNTIADAETGRDKMAELGLSYEQVEAGCKLCDERHALAQKLSEAQATMADESAIQSEIDTLDAAKADADRKYAAQRAPLVAKLAALGSAAFVATDCRNKLLKNPLPHVRAKLASLRAKRKPLADESNRATERVKTAEARERWLESALADVAGRLEDRKNFSTEGRQKFVDEQTVLNRKLREHRMGSLAPSRRVASEVGQRLAAVDAEIAAVEAEALKPWPA